MIEVLSQEDKLQVLEEKYIELMVKVEWIYNQYESFQQDMAKMRESINNLTDLVTDTTGAINHCLGILFKRTGGIQTEEKENLTNDSISIGN